MGLVLDALNRAKSIALASREAATLEDRAPWDAALAAIRATESRADMLEAKGLEGLKILLQSISGGSPLSARIDFIRGAQSLSELTADALADAEDLAADTERRRLEREALVSWFLELGEVGAQLLLRFLVL